MDTLQLRRYARLVRVQEFGRAHAALFPAASLAHQTFAAVEDAVQQLSTHTVSTLSSAQGGITTKAMVRADLTKRLTAISQTGRVIAEQTPGLEQKFVLPRFPSDEALLMTARAFAQDVEPIADRFVAHVMPETFLADLKDAIGRFEQAIHAREAGKDARLAARASIQAALASGDAAVRALDAMVTNRLGDDPVTMAVWKRDRRREYPAARARTAVTDPPVTPAAGTPAAGAPAGSPAPAVAAPSTTGASS